MCDMCKKVEESHPDMGPGAFLAVTQSTVGLSTDDETGIRITQERDVSYVGPQGTEIRHEVESIYLAWEHITPLLINIIAVQMSHGKQGEL